MTKNASLELYFDQTHPRRYRRRYEGYEEEELDDEFERDQLPKMSQLFFIEKPIVSLDDVILPKSTRKKVEEAILFLKRGGLEVKGFGNLYEHRGFCILFSGPSGTGKTLTAKAIAYELGKPLYCLNYSKIENMWLGNTEKNLRRVFEIAQRKSCVLFFDEVDYLLTSRGSVTDREYEGGGGSRYLNREVNIILQELDKFDGIAIFSTNLSLNLDRALERRIQMKILFENPDVNARKELWTKHLKCLPKNVRLAKDVDVNKLAIEFEINGGQIRNIVYSAFRKAFIRRKREGRIRLTLEELEEATKEELNAKSAMNYAFSGEFYRFGVKVNGGYV
jgi:SpoVK/Ycf46/Vps4 family AAA+-type ATPase